MSAYFSYLADELTEIEERLAEPALAPYAEGLRRAIGRAFVLACEAGRVARRDAEAAAAERAQAEAATLQRAKAA